MTHATRWMKLKGFMLSQKTDPVEPSDDLNHSPNCNHMQDPEPNTASLPNQTTEL